MLTEVVRSNLQSCWIGYFLDKEHNGKGYMTEAVKLVVEYAFKDLNLHRIEAGVMPHNIGSMNVLLKAGFHKEGIAKKNVKINGTWENHQILAIINDKSV
jgi:[ribosomal protein S5]-alanine N-acetyltransferase